MGLTEDQKIDLAVAYINQCEDKTLLKHVIDITKYRLMKLIFEEGEG